MNYNTKTIARLAAVQALYLHKSTPSLSTDELITYMLDYYKDESIAEDYGLPANAKIKLHKNYFRSIVTFALQAFDEINEIIKLHLTDDKTIDELDNTLLALLQAGVTELKFYPETPFKIIINEYTNIASTLLKENDIAFVNSTLDFAYHHLSKGDE